MSYNMVRQLTKQSIINAFRKYVNASDGFKDDELAKEEVAAFWRERPELCASTTSESGELQTQPQPQSNQGQVQGLNDQLPALERQLADVTSQNTALTTQNTALTTQNTALTEQVTALQAQVAQFNQRQMVPQADLDRVMAEAWQIVRDRDAVINERDFLRNVLRQIYGPVQVLQNMFNILLNGNGNGR